jgi:hypothetical protein
MADNSASKALRYWLPAPDVDGCAHVGCGMGGMLASSKLT